MSDLTNIAKNPKWNFDWKVEFNDLSREVYKLTIVNNPDIIQGLLSVTGNLVAYACKRSFQSGFDVLTAKTGLVKHYEKLLGAYHFKNQRMILDTEASSYLVTKYFKTK